MYDGLGSFVERLEREGELVRVRREVDPYLEIAEIADRTMKAGGPALLFERPQGSRYPLLINAYGSRKRMSLALGVTDLEEHARRIAELVHTKAPGSAKELAEMARRLPALGAAVPRKVSRAACQEVTLEGEQVDLDTLPVMTTWPKDGGPFFTLPNVITRDPDTGVRNIGMYRMQRIDRRTTAMHWQIHKTGARHFRRAKELGKRLEVAVAFGGDPALTYAATAPLPDGIDEWMFAGFLRGRSVEHVACKTVDLEVPACADFVLEGYVDPREPMFDEGPFGDHTGYYTPVDAFPRFHVTCVTHRKDPIYPSTVVGPPPMEDAWLGKATERLFLPLLRMMFPEVVDMNLPIEGAFHNLAIVSIKKQYPFHASRIAHGLWGAGQMSFTKVICVVDDDVDVQNTAEVSWRLLANLDPKRDVSMVDGPVDQLDHGASQALWGGKMAIDGTKKWPEEGYTRDWPEVCSQSPSIRARVDAMWPELGIPLAARAPAANRKGKAEPRLERRAEDKDAHATGNREMFDRIAPSYDRMNRVMSLGIDRRWRVRAVEMLRSALGAERSKNDGAGGARGAEPLERVRSGGCGGGALMSIRIRRRGAGAFTERVESFAANVKSDRERTAKLLGGPRTTLHQDPNALREALEELRNQHDELVVAEEELRAQLDELGRMGLRLEAERERYADLFERAPDAYLVTDRFGVIRDANAAAVHLFSLEIRYLRGKPMSAFVDPTAVRGMNEALDKLERGVNRLVELGVRPRGGGQVPVIAHVSLTSRGQRLLWNLREATTHHADHPQDLARALRDKEELLSRERRTREELERANRAKDRFIAVLSHDLRAPLNAILGWTQLLRREVLDQTARSRAFETIERNARTQAKLIEELLDISRMAADRVQLALAPVDSGALVQRVLEGALPRASELGLELAFAVEPDLTVICDRQRLEQVVTNLLSNALKFTPASGRIDVEVKRDGGHVKIVVRDTGKGIPRELLPHIFEMYTQERNYSSARNGLGLGLYIVKQLVELQDGSVAAESEGEGRGATFTVLLPLHEEVVAAPSEAAIEPPVALRNLRVLVVDDEEDSRELMATVLRRAGADVACAGGVKSAIDLFGTWTPDVVVSDLAMPGADGCELIGMLRKKDPLVAALAVSGFTGARDTDRALAAGFDVHVGKPVDAAELVEAVFEASRLRHH